jgi:transposase InsO family protein
MKQFIRRAVQECHTCQRAKPERVRYPGLLQPLPVPQAAWEIVSMDSVEGFPKSGRFDSVMVVVDKFSRYAHFIAISHPYTAETIAHLFLDHIFKLHSMPLSIISDRDRIFTSSFWRELFRLTGTKLRLSSSYHPQTDSQTERVNQSLEAFLRCFAQACPRRWAQWLSLAEYWYNTNWHSALNKSPFEILYNHPPRHFGLVPADACPVTDLQVWLDERNTILELLRQQLLRVQQKMKASADKKRSFREFAVDDLVFLKLQPYIQNSVVLRSNQKLAYKYYGPYRVLARVGKVAYRLDLPEASCIHPVIHVSQLKRAIGPGEQVQSDLPIAHSDMQVPIKMLQKRVCRKGGSNISQVLVQWSGMSEELATWEDTEALRQHFPAADAWGQASSQDGGIVSDLQGDAQAGPSPRRRSSRARQLPARLHD